ncbi:hypothetical protein [Stutzerimonas stutzeri]|uniref:hypothetical protein n=1 Tax=Stutzerimonas stutzeri TaxID=316 RepID=UPI00190D03DA|nr:hypothetical protein [Stutzerimonas stutzeri]
MTVETVLAGIEGSTRAIGLVVEVATQINMGDASRPRSASVASSVGMDGLPRVASIAPP